MRFVKRLSGTLKIELGNSMSSCRVPRVSLSDDTEIIYDRQRRHTSSRGIDPPVAGPTFAVKDAA